MNRLTELLLIGGAILALITFFGYSQYQKGKREVLEELAVSRAESAAEKRAIENEIDLLSDTELRRRALEWVR